MSEDNCEVEYVWDEGELIKAFEVAIKLGTGIKTPRKTGLTSGNSEANAVEFKVADYGDGGFDYIYDPCDESQVDGAPVWEMEGYLDAQSGEYVYGAYAEEGDYTYQSEYIEGMAEVDYSSNLKSSGWDQREIQSKKYEGQSISKLEENGIMPKQVHFSGDAEAPKTARANRRQRRQAQREAEAYEKEQNQDKEDTAEAKGGDFYFPDLNETPDWSKSFPALTAPPMPSSFKSDRAFKKGDMSSLLMTWYMCGYQSGYYDALNDMNMKAKD